MLSSSRSLERQEAMTTEISGPPLTRAVLTPGARRSRYPFIRERRSACSPATHPLLRRLPTHIPAAREQEDTQSRGAGPHDVPPPAEGCVRRAPGAPAAQPLLPARL